ncbi:MAG: hypothetical protein R8M38_05750 [Mariprofundaceae bacterium]
MSGDWLPHSGVFLGWNFGTWNHHGSHSSLKMHSKWDCHSSTQRFASGSMVKTYRKDGLLHYVVELISKLG